MPWDNSLPFERGDTYKGINTASTAIPNVSIGGSVYPANDNEAPIGGNEGHQTGAVQEVMAVVNRAGASITLSRRGVRLSTLNSQAYVGGAIGGLVAANGVRGLVTDDAYASGKVIGAGDIFYVVTRGVVKQRCSTRGGAIVTGAALAWTTGAKLRNAGTSMWAVAIAGQSCSTENVQKLVTVVSPFRLRS